MTKDLALLLGEMQAKLNGYAMTMKYEYCNLCVKSDPVSLLPIEVPINGDMYSIEKVAQVTRPDDQHLELYPMSPEIFNEISFGVTSAHPEFEQKRMAMLEDGKKVAEQDVPVGATVVYHLISLTMPPVNKDRRDVLKEAVKVAYDATKQRIDTVSEVYVARIPTCIPTVFAASDEGKANVKEAMGEAKKLYNKNVDLIGNIRKDKEQEIEDAYEDYLKQHQQKRATVNEEYSDGTSMKMPSMEDSTSMEDSSIPVSSPAAPDPSV